MTELSTPYRPSCVSYDTVMRWKNKFESGVESIKNAPKSGRQNLHLVKKSFRKLKKSLKEMPDLQFVILHEK